MLRPHIVFAGTLASLLACAQPAHAADPKPEIERKPASPQAVGKLHTLRSIPEACARLEGTFTGDAATPYKFNAVRTSERCGARARLVDAKTAKPSVANGWRLNDVLKIADKIIVPLQPSVSTKWCSCSAALVRASTRMPTMPTCNCPACLDCASSSRNARVA